MSRPLGARAAASARRRGFGVFAARALLLASMLAACSGRDHTNPFDPANPDTKGHPANLRAVAGDGKVSLSWDDFGFQDISGYRILRSRGDEPMSPLGAGPLPPGATAYDDGGLTARALYRYRLAIYVEDQEAPLLGAEEAASPGPAIAWTADAGTGRVWRLSPDARDLVGGIAVSAQIADLAPVEASGDVWVADYAGGRLLRLDPEARSVESLTAPPGVIAVATDPNGRLIFAGSYDTGDVWGYNAGHSHVWSDDSTGTGVEDLAWNNADGSLWMADKSGRVARFDGAGGGRLSLLEGFVQPFSISIAADGSAAWLVDAGAADRVYKIAASGDTVLALTNALLGPADVAADPAGGCWVVDAVAGRVVRFDDGLTGILVSAGGLSGPRAVRVDPVTREVWVAEPGNGRIVRLSPEGEVIAAVGGMSTPFALAIAWRSGPGVRP